MQVARLTRQKSPIIYRKLPRRRPKCCGTCGHFLSEGPYGDEAYHGKKGGGGVVTCKVSEDLYIPVTNRTSGWCSCERCILFATPELRAILFPPGTRIRKQQQRKRKASSSVGSNGEGGDVNAPGGGDGVPPVVVVEEEEEEEEEPADKEAAAAAASAAVAPEHPATTLGGWTSMFFSSGK